MKIHDCYWCGKVIGISSNGEENWAICRNSKCAVGPTRATRELAIEAWNSLASRLKPEPKVVTIKRWATVFLDGDDKYVTTGLFEEEVYARTFCDRRTYIDTVEVSITFTDSRGVV